MIDMMIDEVEKIKTAVENRNYTVQLVNIVAKTMIEAFENLKIEDVNMFQLGYNKAIDDFVEELKRKTSMENRLIDEIAEQLKTGGKNG